MKQRFRKFLYTMDCDSRIATTRLAKVLKTSQQSASYLKKQMEKKRYILGYNALFDPVRLGFTNIIVGFNLIDFSKEKKNRIISELQSVPSIVAVEEARRGVDLIVEFCERNLSSFNKTYMEQRLKLQADVETRFMFPVIVKHRFRKNYLRRGMDYDDRVFCGDREHLRLSEKEKDVLAALVRHPDWPLSKMAESTSVSIKTFIAVKRKIEAREFIRGYSCILNIKKLALTRAYLMVRVSPTALDDINRMLQFAINSKHIIEFTKVIGHHQVLIKYESEKPIDMISELRSEFQIQDYLHIPIDQIHKESYADLVL